MGGGILVEGGGAGGGGGGGEGEWRGGIGGDDCNLIILPKIDEQFQIGYLPLYGGCR